LAAEVLAVHELPGLFDEGARIKGSATREQDLPIGRSGTSRWLVLGEDGGTKTMKCIMAASTWVIVILRCASTSY
jgi:hypothetical protein